jgi:hypothetical protein
MFLTKESITHSDLLSYVVDADSDDLSTTVDTEPIGDNPVGCAKNSQNHELGTTA